jgi:hypothetical protein
MPPFLYRCPNKGARKTTHMDVGEIIIIKPIIRPRLDVVTAQTHLVNPKNGKVLGSDDE